MQHAKVNTLAANCYEGFPPLCFLYTRCSHSFFIPSRITRSIVSRVWIKCRPTWKHIANTLVSKQPIILLDNGANSQSLIRLLFMWQRSAVPRLLNILVVMSAFLAVWPHRWPQTEPLSRSSAAPLGVTHLQEPIVAAGCTLHIKCFQRGNL